MKILVPFIYEALIVKPRCTKPSLVVIKDSVEVEIKQVSTSDVPVAFRIGSTELRWDGECLWDFSCTSACNEEPRKVSIDTVIKNTQEHGANYKWSNSGAEAPFHNFWGSFSDTMWSRHSQSIPDTINTRGIHQWLKDDSVVDKSQVEYRTWKDDNRDAVIAKAKTIANNMLVVDGIIYRPADEPFYAIETFGFGNNHGSTGFFIELGSKLDTENLEYSFNALRYAEACAKGDEVAANRGDTKSIPVRDKLENIIEVLIPEAVLLDPQADYAAIAAVGNLEDYEETSDMVNVSNLYLVSGRIPGDIDDKQHIVEANSAGKAEEGFRVRLVSDIGGHEGLIDDVILNNIVKLSAAINNKITTN